MFRCTDHDTQQNKPKIDNKFDFNVELNSRRAALCVIIEQIALDPPSRCPLKSSDETSESRMEAKKIQAQMTLIKDFIVVLRYRCFIIICTNWQFIIYYYMKTSAPFPVSKLNFNAIGHKKLNDENSINIHMRKHYRILS